MLTQATHFKKINIHGRVLTFLSVAVEILSHLRLSCGNYVTFFLSYLLTYLLTYLLSVTARPVRRQAYGYLPFTSVLLCLPVRDGQAELTWVSFDCGTDLVRCTVTSWNEASELPLRQTAALKANKTSCEACSAAANTLCPRPLQVVT